MNENTTNNSAVITWNGQSYIFTLDSTAIQLVKNPVGVPVVALEPMGTNEVYHNFLLRLRVDNGGKTANE